MDGICTPEKYDLHTTELICGGGTAYISEDKSPE